MRYRLTGKTARTLGNGNTLAPGETVTLTGEECEQHDTAWLLAEGLLVEEPADEPEPEDDEPLELVEPPTPKPPKKKKTAASETAATETPEDGNENGGSDR